MYVAEATDRSPREVGKNRLRKQTANQYQQAVD